ncbi:hypothetical protein Syun_025199 [Stephania yunnanensis]|uniref:Translation initiation factor IF-3 n=1 Tax=Stephania yunnanensis TaxID=152371 RepID=A0AAP0F017_9MAGN
MASSGLTSTFSFKPVLYRRGRAVCPLFLESEFSGIRVSCVNLARVDSGVCVSAASVTAITARMGGGRYRPTSSSSDDEDGALDVSSIRSPSVRLIDAEQNMVGIVPKSEAIQMADEAELDLVCPLSLVFLSSSFVKLVSESDFLSHHMKSQMVEVEEQWHYFPVVKGVILSPDADPPVVRIMNYSESCGCQRAENGHFTSFGPEIGVRVNLYNIDSHDYSVRLKAAQKFLKEGDKVKVIVNLKGRENEFRNIAIALLRRFQEEIGELATEESKNFRERNVFIVLAPNKAVLQKAQDQPKKREKPASTEISASV